MKLSSLRPTIALVLLPVSCVFAQDTTRDATPSLDPRTWRVAVLGAQATVIGQSLSSFRSPYSGPNSLTSSGDRALSDTYGLYLGAAGPWRLQLYGDIEMARGSGVGRAVGLGGPTNGDVIRQGTADLGSGPYVARLFARYVLPFGNGRDTVAAAPDQITTVVAERRLEVTAGKFAASDLLDANRYANSTRSQFMDWGLFQNTAWDFAADTRGYSNGIAAAWIEPRWALRVVSLQMPTQANGNKLDPALDRARGDNAELTLAPGGWLPTLRLLAFINHARMGDYAEALAAAVAQHAVPNIVADDRPGRRKSGVAINLEKALADSGDTGLFARAGRNDGRTESFAFAEVDAQASGGVQVSGVHWSRASDRFGAALLVSGISAVHQQYLAAGGTGFLLGDGALRYGPERVVEVYYSASVFSHLVVGPALQRITNPGYNRDRGPATVLTARARVAY